MVNQSTIGRHRAFTLIELLVVIGIIGILSTIALATFSGSTDSARAARCLTNMRNLAAAVQTYGMSHGHYPLAGSVERFEIDVKRGKKNMKTTYDELSGWVSWNSGGAFRSAPTSKQHSSSWNLSSYETTDEKRQFCLTNGALWKCVSGNHEVYRCPAHVLKCKDGNSKLKGLNPNWSYVMNAYFGCTKKDDDIYDSDYCGHVYGRLKRADRILLFGELQFEDFSGYPTININVNPKNSTGAGIDCDCVLQYKGCGYSGANEYIGFNHVVNRQLYAHVCFADGHCEKLVYPKKGSISEAQMRELTEWLCTGDDVGFDGTEYTQLTDNMD